MASKRKKTTTDDPNLDASAEPTPTERAPRRISVELPESITAEIEEVAKRSSLLTVRDLRELVRERAAGAAELAVAGRVAELARQRVMSELGE